MDQKLRVLLTGASGAVGQELLKQFYQVRTNFDITVFDLKTKKVQKIIEPYRPYFTICYGDITKEESIKLACCEKDVVIHLAAVIPPLADEHPELAEQVNVKGTQNLIRCLEEYSPNVFFLYSSSVSIYGDRVDTPHIFVHDALHPSHRDEYALTKIKAEECILNSNLNWSIFRLSAIMGNHKMTKLMFHMPLATPMEITTTHDTARAFLHALTVTEKLNKKTFNLGGGEVCRTIYRDFIARSFEIAGLGTLDFPTKTFAEKNFHCGYYADGDDLEQLLHFRTDSLESYFEKEKRKIGPLQRQLTWLLQKPIKYFLIMSSEPYQAYTSKNRIEMEHYFNE
jgi:nucleoside-diphosphate-sugar epimerase